MKKCILYEDRETCVSCGDCRCDIDPDKICDNCMQCIRGDADFRAITISGIMLDHEQDSDNA